MWWCGQAVCAACEGSPTRVLWGVRGGAPEGEAHCEGGDACRAPRAGRCRSGCPRCAQQGCCFTLAWNSERSLSSLRIGCASAICPGRLGSFVSGPDLSLVLKCPCCPAQCDSAGQGSTHQHVAGSAPKRGTWLGCALDPW